MEEKLLTPDEMHQIFVKKVNEAGGIAAWARENDVSKRWVSELWNYRRIISPGILLKLGYRRVTRYLPLERRE